MLLLFLKITAKILQVEGVERLDRVKRRVGIFALDVKVILWLDQTSADDFHQQGCIGRPKIKLKVRNFLFPRNSVGVLRRLFNLVGWCLVNGDIAHVLALEQQ